MYDYQKRMLLAMPSDRDSLSDRQCYVRSEMVEIFAATDKDVASRHSKGAQKLVIGQVGIRCVHCSHLRPRDRAERAVCYPSSISRIYQTVADMQRFHFEQCREIPEHVRQIYKKLKTTRPRGVGSPQTYWMSSAKQMGLADTECGIRFEHGDMSKAEHHISVSEMSIGTN
jgi:ribosomal protein S26